MKVHVIVSISLGDGLKLKEYRLLKYCSITF